MLENATRFFSRRNRKRLLKQLGPELVFGYQVVVVCFILALLYLFMKSFMSQETEMEQKYQLKRDILFSHYEETDKLWFVHIPKTGGTMAWEKYFATPEIDMMNKDFESRHCGVKRKFEEHDWLHRKGKFKSFKDMKKMLRGGEVSLVVLNTVLF